MSGWRVTCSVAVAVMSSCALLVFTAVRIELLNAAAGRPLPHTERSLDTGDLVEWRIATPAAAKLRSAVRTWGIAQYPLCVATAIGAAALIVIGREEPQSVPLRFQHAIRAIGVVALLLCACALALAVVRGYLTSAFAGM